jgi:acyl carrier protein
VHIDAITTAVIDTLAAMLEVDVSALDLERSFHDMGLDSVSIVGLSAEFEDRFGITLDPEFAYQHDSVRKISQHLHGVLSMGVPA